MDHRAAFNRTLEMFGLKAKPIAEMAARRLNTNSRTVENQISSFRKGEGDLAAGRLFAIVDSLPAEARAYWFALVMIPPEPPPIHSDELDDSLDLNVHQ
jgi:hypothetical protein